ncbi:MAG: restriction endonuclease subunit S [Bacilli bacterium]|nr:restriction endonuclease subunit S [Bacilli bacterium]
MRFDKLKDFHRQKLGTLCTIVGGYAFDSKKMISKGNYQIVKMGNFYAGKLDLSRTPTFLDNPTQSELSALLKKHDIVITLTGTVNKKDYGYTVQINDENNLLLNQRCALIRAKNNIDSNYLLYLLKSNEFLSQFYASSVGGTGNQTNVSIKAIEQFIVSIPHLDEQKRVGEFLSDIDKRISVQNKIISDLKVLKKELCRKLFNSSHCNKTIEIRQLANIYGGYAFNSKTYNSKGKFKIVTIGNVTGNKYISGDYNRIYMLPGNIHDQQILNNGDILISLTGNVGRISIVNGDNYLLNQRVAKLNVKDKLIKAYIYHYLSNSSFEKDMSNTGQGAAQKNIKNEDILSYKIRIPISQAYLEKIVGLLSMCDKLIVNEENYLLNLNFQKSFLLNAMFI